MDFIDELRQFSKRAESLKSKLPTEEATKNALILPFFQLLGYDVFNPMEFMPEFTADVGIKKGEKVDYAIFLNGKPAILIEAKWCNNDLDKHDSQLFRYFGTTDAKFGILTNGLVYKFYTDLDEPNKMDLTPFLEFDLLNFNEGIIPELKRFSKEKIDIEDAFNAASELKYTNAIKALLAQQRVSPDDGFIAYILGEVYPGRRTQQIVEKFQPIIKKALNAYINDVINDTLKSAMQKHDEAPAVAKEQPPQAEHEQEAITRVETTQLELEGYWIIKSILRSVLSPDEITYKDTETYFGILVGNNTRKWICRLKLEEGKKMQLILPDEKVDLTALNDLYLFADKLEASAKRFVKDKAE